MLPRAIFNNLHFIYFYFVFFWGEGAMNVSSYYVFLPLGLLGYILALLQTSS